jgi:hypothetical protein
MAASCGNDEEKRGKRLQMPKERSHSSRRRKQQPLLLSCHPPTHPPGGLHVVAWLLFCLSHLGRPSGGTCMSRQRDQRNRSRNNGADATSHSPRSVLQVALSLSFMRFVCRDEQLQHQPHGSRGKVAICRIEYSYKGRQCPTARQQRCLSVDLD